MKGSVTGHYVAIQPQVVEKVSDGGIVLPEEYNDNERSRAEAASTRGTVVSIGPTAWLAYDSGHEKWKPWADIGDDVWFKRHTAKVIEDFDDLDEDGKPRKIFVIADENVIWNNSRG